MVDRLKQQAASNCGSQGRCARSLLSESIHPSRLDARVLQFRATRTEPWVTWRDSETLVGYLLGRGRGRPVAIPYWRFVDETSGGIEDGGLGYVATPYVRDVKQGRNSTLRKPRRRKKKA